MGRIFQMRESHPTCKEMKINCFDVPASMTHVWQPCDLRRIANLKDQVDPVWTEYIASLVASGATPTQVATTVGEKSIAIIRQRVYEHILRALSGLSSNAIVHGFEQAAWLQFICCAPLCRPLAYEKILVGHNVIEQECNKCAY